MGKKAKRGIKKRTESKSNHPDNPKPAELQPQPTQPSNKISPGRLAVPGHQLQSPSVTNENENSLPRLERIHRPVRQPCQLFSPCGLWRACFLLCRRYK